MKSLNFPFRSLALSMPLLILLFTAMGFISKPAVITSGQLRGKIMFDGPVPPPKKVPNTSDSDIGPVFYEDLIVNKGGVANVFVHISAVKAKNYPSSSNRKVIEIKGHQFRPRVVGVMTNQPLAFKNSDGILYNVHGLPKVNNQFNLGMPPTAKAKTMRFAKPEGPFKVKCDVHPWMSGYVAVMTHPYFAVSDQNGNFRINTVGLEPGTYKIRAWHEKLGTRTGTAKVIADDVIINLKF
jgi:plastocyanin